MHQLVHVSGLVARHDDFPVWLHEGLAMQFEVIRGGRWAGIGRINPDRLSRYRALAPPPRLEPLVRDQGFGHGYQPGLYGQAWAPTYYLRAAHPDQFLAILDLLRAPTPRPVSRPDRTLRAFRSVFGPDLSGLESSWHRFLDDLPASVWSGRPAVGSATGSSPSGPAHDPLDSQGG